MRQYKIYNRVQTDPSRKSMATFGCNEWFRQEVLIGTSSKNSWEAGILEVEHTEDEDKHYFSVVFAGFCLRRFEMNKKTKEMKKVYDHQDSGSFDCCKCGHHQEVRPNTFCDECGMSNA